MSRLRGVLHLSSFFLDHGSYLLLFLATILEGIPPIGFIVPGQTIAVIAGFLAKQGILSLRRVIIIIALGAILGDVISYFLGREYGYSFIARYGKYFFFKKEQYEKTKRVMEKHAGKSLFFGRFYALTRPITPLIAGITDVPLGRFMFFNVVGGILWAICFVMIGYVFGSSYHLVSPYIGRFLIFAFIASIGLIYLYRAFNKQHHIFFKYHLHTLALCIISLYIYARMIDDIVREEFITRIDGWVSTHIVEWWHPLLTKLMVLITMIGSASAMTFLSLVLLITFFIKKKKYHALIAIITIVEGIGTELLTKLILQRAQPVPSLITISGYSFPSGQATMTTIFFVLLIHSFRHEIKNKNYKILIITASIIASLLISLSAIYLNVSWVSDVIAGCALGVFWFTFAILLVRFVRVSYTYAQGKLSSVKR